MSVDITWLLSGVDARRWKIQRGSMWRPPVSVRGTSIQVPGRHGSIAPGLPVFEAPTVSLEMLLVGDQVSLEEAQAELVGLLSAPGLVLGRSSGGVVTEGGARLLSLSPSGFAAGRSARFEVLLTVPSVFLRGAEVDSVLAPGTGPVPGLTGSTAPVGDALLRIQGPQNPVVTDVVSGTGISWEGTLDDAWYLYVDLTTMQAWISQDVDAWDRVNGQTVLTNLCINGSFETGDLTGWSSSNAGFVTDAFEQMAGREGQYMIQAESDGSAPYLTVEQDFAMAIPVTPGLWVAMRAWAAVDGSGRHPTGGVYQYRNRFRFGTSGEGYVYADSGWRDWQSFYTGQWDTLSFQVPAGKSIVRAAGQMFTGDDLVNMTATARLWMDQVIVAVGDTQTEAEAAVAAYFDGDTPDTPIMVHAWDGTPHLSTSKRTINTDATSGLDYPPAGRLQLWPRMNGGAPSSRDATVTVSGATEVVVRARPAYL